MSITRAQFDVQITAARRMWGELIDAAEHRHGLPIGLLYAVGSRETNLSPSFTRGSVGDHGHGHGLFQLDDRWHAIPPNFNTDVAAQAETAAAMLAGFYKKVGSWRSALNMYNSGKSSDVSTTGGNYGSDVLGRLALISGAGAAIDHQPELRRGSQGPAVAHWQAIIGVAADGDFGALTESATKRWQFRHGCNPDGVVGLHTWAACGR